MTNRSEKEHVIPTQKHADLIIECNESENLLENVEKIKDLTDLYFQDKTKFKKKVAELRTKTKNQELVPYSLVQTYWEREEMLNLNIGGLGWISYFSTGYCSLFNSQKN